MARYTCTQCHTPTSSWRHTQWDAQGIGHAPICDTCANTPTQTGTPC